MSDQVSSDQERLAGYIDVWWRTVNDFVDLLETLDASEWSAPTDLPGWDVKAVASHVAHLEGILAGAPEETAEVGEPPHVTGLMGLYTEIGVVNRRDSDPDAIINELRSAVTKRHTQLLADPPTDAEARPETVFGGVPWTWERLLRNRPLDIWMHEQDVRRATDRPGGLESAAARHTATYLAESLGFVLGKKAGAPSGTTLVLELTAPVAADQSQPDEVVAFTVNAAGRGEPLPEPPADPTVRLRMDRETFICLAGGRRAAAPGAVAVEGDAELGDRVLAGLATTP